MIQECKKIFLVDISSFVFRAYYGIRPLHHSSGQATHAVYGVVSMLLRLIREKKPENLVIVFDSPKPSFRKEIYKEYKANREAPPEDLPAQFEFIKKFVSLYPLPSFQVDGFEADDIIATVVHHCREEKDFEVVIVSADKDLMQLIGDQVSMYDSMKERWIDEAFVVERFAVGPTLVGDVLALAGDASDNIPGVKGIGEKTAGKLIKQFGSVENLYEHLSEIPGKMGENLKNSKDAAFLSKQLVTLKYDVPIEFKIDEIHLREPAQTALNDFFREMEFKTFLTSEANPADSPVSSAPKMAQGIFKLVLSETEFNAVLQQLGSEPGFAFDTETTGLNTWKDMLVGLSIGLNEKEAYYIPLEHSYLGCPPMLSRSKVIAALKPYFEDKSKFKWAQNGKFDMEVLKKEGIEVTGLSGDSLLASYLLNPEGSHNLDFLAKKYLGHQMISFESVVPKNETFASVTVEQACEYAAEDAWAAFNLCKLLHEDLKKEDLWHCYEHIELPLVPVLAAMEEKGILIDQPLLRNLHEDFTSRIIQLEADIQKDASCEFNVSSPKQLAHVLFEKLGLPVQKKIKTGYSTDVEVLTTLAPLHPIAQKLLNHRSLAKLKSTYIDQLRSLVFADGRIRTHYHQSGTATGRLSSSDPNLQNIPIRSEDGLKIRSAFIAPEGSKILSADYSQIELRLLAELSKDAALINAFKNNEDIHSLTASRIFNEVNKQTRAMAKTVNFGVLYGQSAFGLAQLLNVSQTEAKKFIDEFYNQFPSVGEFKNRLLDIARTNGWVRTWMGRRRLIPEINSKNGNLRANAERLAFNTTFQGSAADLIKVAMIHIHQRLKGENFKTNLILQVHDELVFEVPENELEKIRILVKQGMEQAHPSEVPLTVEIGVGENWAMAH